MATKLGVLTNFETGLRREPSAPEWLQNERSLRQVRSHTRLTLLRRRLHRRTSTSVRTIQASPLGFADAIVDTLNGMERGR